MRNASASRWFFCLDFNASSRRAASEGRMASCWASSAGMIDLYLVHWLLSVFWARHRGIYLWRWTLFTACRCAAVQKAAPQCYLAGSGNRQKRNGRFSAAAQLATYRGEFPPAEADIHAEAQLNFPGSEGAG